MLLAPIGGEEREMICNNCKIRWADFPKEDFAINEKGITPNAPEATTKRESKFNNDNIQCCPDCIDELNAQLDAGTRNYIL